MCEMNVNSGKKWAVIYGRDEIEMEINEFSSVVSVVGTSRYDMIYSISSLFSMLACVFF